jgi:leucyl-tRNA synthetase
MAGYHPHEIEPEWRRRWDESGNHDAHLDQEDGRPHCYCLVMFSYPSGNKLHLGHWFNYGPTDTWARYRRMRGDKVFQPMGFDSFGLPAENYAIKSNVHPRIHTEENIAFMQEQLKVLGAMYDWKHEIQTHTPEYYKWTQWLFLRLYEGGYAYRGKAPVNWCDHCQTVLANEQVSGGLCERCDHEVRQRELTQWFFSITKFADELLEGLERIDWPHKTVAMQRNWIGRSEGAQIRFTIEESPAASKKGAGLDLSVFTTRPDTVFGVTYLVLAPEHPLVTEIVTEEQRATVDAYVRAAAKLSEIDRTSLARQKTGVFSGVWAINPVNRERIPVWIADYVLATYGTGAVMAVPAHDERDFAFAREHGLTVRRVILGEKRDQNEPLEEAWTEDGPMCASGEFDGEQGDAARAKVIAWLEREQKGEGTVNYRLRDWLISRQRYWGAPIPIIHCSHCGEVPVPLADLPVELPQDVEFKPTGESPLAAHPHWKVTSCPKCGGKAEREVDTMDTFVDSSWYYLRYLSPHLSDAPFSKELVKEWVPVAQYVGGAEHAAMHLLYARFIAKALKRLGEVEFDEPFQKLVHQGVITSDGARMSKSRGNVVNPESYLKKYGSDTLRTYLMFGFEYTRGGDWDDKGIHGMFKYLSRVYRFVESHAAELSDPKGTDEGEAFEELRYTRHFSVKMATLDLDRFQFNTALSRHMEFTNELHAYAKLRAVSTWGEEAREIVLDWARMLAPFAPHLGEEIFKMLGGRGTVFDQPWPSWEEGALQRDVVTVVIQVNGKLRDEMEVKRGTSREELQKKSQSHGRIPQWLEGKEIKRVIVVPDKLVNIVVG